MDGATDDYSGPQNTELLDTPKVNILLGRDSTEQKTFRFSNGKPPHAQIRVRNSNLVNDYADPGKIINPNMQSLVKSKTHSRQVLVRDESDPGSTTQGMSKLKVAKPALLSSNGSLNISGSNLADQLEIGSVMNIPKPNARDYITGTAVEHGRSRYPKKEQNQTSTSVSFLNDTTTMAPHTRGPSSLNQHTNKSMNV